jgi:hypothetical protein
MEIQETHKTLLRKLGLGDEDFAKFDGGFVRYEFDEARGVRLYDPYYRTSYGEYIGIDGWSSWSDENDTFMSDLLKGVHETVRRVAAKHERADLDVEGALREKFGQRREDDSPGCRERNDEG